MQTTETGQHINSWA